MKIKMVREDPAFKVIHDSRPVDIGDEIEVSQQTGENCLKKGFERVAVTIIPKTEPRKRTSRAASMEE